MLHHDEGAFSLVADSTFVASELAPRMRSCVHRSSDDVAAMLKLPRYLRALHANPSTSLGLHISEPDTNRPTPEPHT